MTLTTSVRIAVAATSILACFAAVGFVAEYSGIEESDARYLRMKLPIATEYFVTAVPYSLVAVIVLTIIAVVAAARRNDSALIVAACIGWLMAFSWVLLCFLVWRTPTMLLGAQVSR